MVFFEKLEQHFNRIWYFFPVQLFMLHLKRNHFFLFLWFLLFGLITNSVGAKYGVSYLFLYPEYLGHSDFVSFAILGFALGGFVMAFNIFTYVTFGYKFPFIATVSRPFYKFCVNNSLIPSVFYGIFLYQTIKFQLYQEFLGPQEIAFNILGFGLGLVLFIMISLSYFFGTNKDLFKISGVTKEQFEKKYSDPVNIPLHKKKKWSSESRRKKGWKVETYLSNPFKIMLARNSDHYEEELLKKVFAQNHTNAAIFEIMIVTSFILIGSFQENPYFVIPAGASVLLSFTLILMLTSSLFSWFKGWSYSLIILSVLLVNYYSTEISFFHFKNQAYGLNYNQEKAPYTHEHLQEIAYDQYSNEKDKLETLKILKKWKNKHLKKYGNEKPKMILISGSGGGLRAAMWTFQCLQHVDSLMQGRLMDQTQLICGSSGGMIGAAYFRELYLRDLERNSPLRYNPQHLNNMGEDLLNPIMFSVATNDIFFRNQRFEKNNNSYSKDRGFSFERNMNKITGGLLNKKLGAYAEPEGSSTIPMMLLTPSIVNDGRRLVISPQYTSYLSNNKALNNVNHKPGVENIEYLRLFENQDPLNLDFSSALRMSATFPYILPLVSLPSEPRIEVMDAGIRDNYGMQTTLEFLYTFRDWIRDNTGGVVILKIRDNTKSYELQKNSISTIGQHLTTPVGMLYSNFSKIQDFQHDQLIQYTSAWYEEKIDIVELILEQNKNEKISLSWHLTTREKRQVRQAINQKENQNSLKYLMDILNH